VATAILSPLRKPLAQTPTSQEKESTETKIFTFTLDGDVTACISTQDNRTIVAGDGFGGVHFLQIVES
jgi:hypothetical protein